jgi:hypothetical protein
LAQAVRFPVLGIGMLQELLISRKIFLREGGGFIPSGTEKLKPCA